MYQQHCLLHISCKPLERIGQHIMYSRGTCGCEYDVRCRCGCDQHVGCRCWHERDQLLAAGLLKPDHTMIPCAGSYASVTCLLHPQQSHLCINLVL